MKAVIRKAVINTISYLARVVCLIEKPYIIGVTGSAGKTSTRQAIYLLLAKATNYNVIQAKKSYNGEIGLPLTILRRDSGFSNPLEWIKVIALGSYTVFSSLFISILKKRGTKYIVAEYGIDHIGEMDKQLAVVVPNIALITNIAPVHTQNLLNLDVISQEKGKIIHSLSSNSYAIINLDNRFIRRISTHTKANKITYGKQRKGVNIGYSDFRETERGISFVVHDNINRKKYSIQVPVLGKHHVYVILPAIAIGSIFNIDPKKIVNIFKGYKTPPGRLRILNGINKSTIIDGSYNASPITMDSTIKTMNVYKDKYRILFLGDMRELGEQEKEEHRKLANLIVKYSDYVVLVGPLMALYTKPELLKLGYSRNKIFSTLDSEEGGRFIYRLVQGVKKRSVIVCKGSQNTIRLEKGIKIFLSKREDPEKVLVRQEKQWLNIK